VRDAALLAAGLGALALLAARFGLDDVRVALARADPGRLCAYLALTVLALLGHCLRWQLTGRALGLSLPFRRIVRARLAGDAVGWLVPSARLAGEPLRFALVYAATPATRTTPLTPSPPSPLGPPSAQSPPSPCGPRGESGPTDRGDGPRIGAAVAADRIIESVANLACALIYVAVFVAGSAGGGRPRELGLMVGTVAALLVSVGVLLALVRRGFRPLRLLCGPALRRRRPRVGRWLDTIAAGEAHVADFLRDRPGAFIQGLLISLAVEALVIAEYHALLSAFGVMLPLPTLLMSLVTVGMTRAVPTPGGLGALEAGQVTLLELASGQAALGFVVGVVLRLHETLWTAVGLAVLFLEGVSLRATMRLARPRGAVAGRAEIVARSEAAE
jgi:uncharacterized membrane protein YbhN (UPF0104 family)